MTLREMTEALDAGKTVINDIGDKVYKDLDSIFGPYIFENNLGNKYRASKAFDNVESFRISGEPRWRAFKPEEITKEYFNYIYRKKNSLFIRRPVSMYLKSTSSALEFDKWYDVKDLFEEWEVEIDGKWQPVGIKE